MATIPKWWYGDTRKYDVKSVSRPQRQANRVICLFRKSH